LHEADFTINLKGARKELQFTDAVAYTEQLAGEFEKFIVRAA